MNLEVLKKTFRQVNGWVVLGFVLLQLLLSAFANFYLFNCSSLGRFVNRTHGLINGTLIFNAIVFLVIVFILLLKLGNLSMSDLGVDRSHFKPAFMLMIVIWTAVNLVTMATGTGDLKMYNNGFTGMIGVFAGQVFGNAFVEELTFRGFLLRQFYKKSGGNLILALFFSQALFSLIHIPHLMRANLSETAIMVNLLGILATGIFFCLIWIRTGNLLYVVVLHAFCNYPINIMESSLNPQFIPYVIGVLMVIFWPAFMRVTLRWQRKLQALSPPKENN